MTDLPLIAAIVNATGDSFSEGAASGSGSAVERALRCLDAGADWIDLGGESTRPGAAEIAPGEEMDRIMPVLECILRERPGTVVSIDTRHSATAKAALRAGAAVINDVSMLRHDPEMAGVVAGNGGKLVICHSRGTPDDMQSGAYFEYPGGVAAVVMKELEAAEEQALRAGVAREDIWIDPGFGFAKTMEQNRELFLAMEQFCRRWKVFAGVSRKSFIGKVTGVEDPARRLAGTLAAEIWLARKKVDVLRTHDPLALKEALAVCSWLNN